MCRRRPGIARGAPLAIFPLFLLACSGASSGPDGGAAPGDCPSSLSCPGVGVTRLADDGNVSGEIAVTATTLYWVDRAETIADSIHAVGIDGGPQTTFYTAPDTNTAIEAVTVDESDVYWTEVAQVANGYVSAVKAMPQSPSIGASGGARVLASNASDPSEAFFSVAVDATNAYFSGSGLGLDVVPLSGGPAAVLRTGIVGPVTANSTGVYWIELDVQATAPSISLMRLAPGAAEPSPLAANGDELDILGPLPGFGPIAVNLDTVVWIAGDGSVRSVPIAGGGASVLAPSEATATFVAVDDSNAFVIEGAAQSPGLIVELPLGGAAATTIASGMGVAGGYSAYQAVATDGVSVYWAGSSGVFKASP